MYIVVIKFLVLSTSCVWYRLLCSCISLCFSVSFLFPSDRKTKGNARAKQATASPCQNQPSVVLSACATTGSQTISPLTALVGRHFRTTMHYICAPGGYSMLGHNELRNFTASVMHEVCHDVPLSHLFNHWMVNSSQAIQMSPNKHVLTTALGASGVIAFADRYSKCAGVCVCVCVGGGGGSIQRSLCNYKVACEPALETRTPQETPVQADSL